jgi:hypothetical protein
MAKSIAALKKFFYTYPAILLLMALMCITRPYYYADSFEFAHTIMDKESGNPTTMFLESGHSLWRPLGLGVCVALKPILNFFFPQWEFAEASASLIIVVVILTLFGTIYLYRILRLLPISERSVQFMMLLYVSSQCVLNYSQTGASYQAGLSVLIIGLFYVLHNPERAELKDTLVGGAVLAIAPFLWFPYVLALPAAILARPIIYGWKRKNIENSLKLIIAWCVFSGLLFLPIAVYQNMSSIGDISKWFFRPGNAPPSAGPLRTLFGLSKTLFYLGEDGLYVKRFLYHDPYNPVSAISLISLGLWKVALFYFLLAISIVTIWRRPAIRRYLLFLLVGFIPTIALSISWDGSALERHMPLLPFLFIGFALALENGSKAVKYLFAVVGITTLVVNLSGLWYATNRNDESRVGEKIAQIWPRLNDHSIVAVISMKDDVSKFRAIHPFNSFNQSSKLQQFELIGYNNAHSWKNRFESASIGSWSEGGNVWVSRTLLASAPERNMYWIEGADPVSWREISNYFQSLRYSDSTKDFLLLQRGSFDVVTDLNGVKTR